MTGTRVEVGRPGADAVARRLAVTAMVGSPNRVLAMLGRMGVPNDPDGAAAHHVLTGLARLFRCDFAGALQAAGLAESLVPADGGQSGELVTAVVGLIRSVGQTGTAAVNGPRTRHTSSDPVLGFLLAETSMSRGELAEAELTARAALGSPQLPDGLAFLLQLTLTRALIFQGRLEAAAEHAELGRRAADRSGIPLLAALSDAVRALVEATRGAGEAAKGLVERALERSAGMVPDRYLVSGVGTLCAFALSALGLPERAAAILVDRAGGPGLPRLQLVDRAFGYEMLTMAALQGGDPESAARWVQRGAALAADWPGDPAGMARCALDRAAAQLEAVLGAQGRTVQLAQSAIRAAADAGGRLEVVRALLVAGGVQVGRRAEAISDLERAADEAGELGAIGLRDQAARRLREIGRRLPPLTGAGFAALTERERQIAHLLVAGRSNQQIAGELHLSSRTVQAHVTRVLRAFGVHSRWAMAAAVKSAAGREDSVGQGDAAATERSPAPSDGRARGGIRPVELGAAVQRPTSREPLVGRQAQVASLAALGWSNGRIGGELGLSVKTVEKYLSQVYDGWRISSRAELAALLHGGTG